MKSQNLLSRSLLGATVGFGLAAALAAFLAESWPTAVFAGISVLAAGATAWLLWRAPQETVAHDGGEVADILGVLDRTLDRDVEGIEAEIHRVQNLIGEAVAELSTNFNRLHSI